MWGDLWGHDRSSKNGWVFARQTAEEKEKESFGWRELGAKARRWKSGWESVSSQEGWLEHRGSAGQQDAAAALNARLVLSPEGAGEPWNGFVERRNVIRTGCPNASLAPVKRLDQSGEMGGRLGGRCGCM